MMEEETNTPEPRPSRRRWLLVLPLLIVIAVIWFVWRQHQPPLKASIAVPGAKQLALGHDQTVPIEIDTAGQTINAAEVYINFDPKVVQVQSVNVDGSVFTVQITGQPTFDNTKGEISFAGGIPKPGFKGKGKIGAVVLTAKTAATTSLSFDARTQMLLNDGLGTAVPLKLEPVKVTIK